MQEVHSEKPIGPLKSYAVTTQNNFNDMSFLLIDGEIDDRMLEIIKISMKQFLAADFINFHQISEDLLKIMVKIDDFCEKPMEFYYFCEDFDDFLTKNVIFYVKI